MEIKKAEELRKVWGEKPCSHPALKKVIQTKDKVCIACGRVVYAHISSSPSQGLFKW